MNSDWASTSITNPPQSASTRTPLDHRIEDNEDDISSSGSGTGKGKELEVRRFPEEEDEEILKESNARFVLFPIKYREVSYVFRYLPSNGKLTWQIWQAYKASQASFWTAEELDLGHDMVDWTEKLTENERFFILRKFPPFSRSMIQRLTGQAYWRSSLHQTES